MCRHVIKYERSLSFGPFFMTRCSIMSNRLAGSFFRGKLRPAGCCRSIWFVESVFLPVSCCALLHIVGMEAVELWRMWAVHACHREVGACHREVGICHYLRARCEGTMKSTRGEWYPTAFFLFRENVCFVNSSGMLAQKIYKKLEYMLGMCIKWRTNTSSFYVKLNGKRMKKVSGKKTQQYYPPPP